MPKDNIFKRVYDFYSADLTTTEFEKIIMKEAPIRYKYYLQSMEKPEPHNNKFVEVFSFLKNLAIAFLKKLSPLIRIAYTLTIIAFFIALIQGSWNLALLSFCIVNFLLVFEVADKLTARDELDVARDVQTSLIPVNSPEDKNFEIASHYETAKEVGGDFIDFIPKPEGGYYISIGDVSGKGMSAALYMVQVRLLIRYLADKYENPREILAQLNKDIFKHIRKGLYLSAVLADVKDNTLRICRAGHTPLLYYDSIERVCREVKQNGMALGLSNGDIFKDALEEFEIKLNKGDILLFYSDGLTEAMNNDKKEFGKEKVMNILRDSSHKSTAEIKNDIISEVWKFRGYAEMHDDLTMIIMKAV